MPGKHKISDEKMPDGDKDLLRCCKDIYWFLVTKRHHLYFGHNQNSIDIGIELVRLATEHLYNTDIQDEQRFEIMKGLKERMLDLIEFGE